MRVEVSVKHQGAVKANRPPGRAGPRSTGRRAASEQKRWDPKDGELCLSRTKPEETLVEVRSATDVQIVRQTWV